MCTGLVLGCRTKPCSSSYFCKYKTKLCTSMVHGCEKQLWYSSFFWQCCTRAIFPIAGTVSVLLKAGTAVYTSVYQPCEWSRAVKGSLCISHHVYLETKLYRERKTTILIFSYVSRKLCVLIRSVYRTFEVSDMLNKTSKYIDFSFYVFVRKDRCILDD